MADDILKGTDINSAGFGTIPKLAMQDRRLHIAAKAIYAYFNSYAGGGDTCFPSRKKICFDLGISSDTLGKYLKQLVDNGYIKVEQIKQNGKFSHNVYTLCNTILPLPKTSDTENSVHGNLVTNNNINNINSNLNIISNKKESKKPKSGYDIIIDGYTDNEVLKTSLYEFIKMRKMIAKPCTDFGLKKLLSKLDKLGQTDEEKIAIVDQSTMCNWQGLFPLKDEYKPQPEETEEDRIRREQDERLAKLMGG